MAHQLNEGSTFKSKLLPAGNRIEVVKIDKNENALHITYREESYTWNLRLTIEGFDDDGEYRLV